MGKGTNFLIGLSVFMVIITVVLAVSNSLNQDTKPTTAKPDIKPTPAQAYQSWASDTKQGIMFYGDCSDATVYLLRVECVVATMIIEEVDAPVSTKTQYARAFDNCMSSSDLEGCYTALGERIISEQWVSP